QGHCRVVIRPIPNVAKGGARQGPRYWAAQRRDSLKRAQAEALPKPQSSLRRRAKEGAECCAPSGEKRPPRQWTHHASIRTAFYDNSRLGRSRCLRGPHSLSNADVALLPCADTTGRPRYCGLTRGESMPRLFYRCNRLHIRTAAPGEPVSW